MAANLQLIEIRDTPIDPITDRALEEQGQGFGIQAPKGCNTKSREIRYLPASTCRGTDVIFMLVRHVEITW